ncbi:unnamed protein product [Porites lobata]|uniref:Endonuclease/exonuclease/phosphatase domain-containing protein n=1 Tax=Porites lobata TaxID=104759 RepID=A0ABN8NSJ4_9CNID|nr:unnamed protein product [Porites lobata]
MGSPPRGRNCRESHRLQISSHEGPSHLRGKEDKHEQGVGFLVHNGIVNTAYAPTSDYDGDAVEDFYEHLQEILDHSLKNGTLVVLGDWNAKVGEDALKNWKGTCGR